MPVTFLCSQLCVDDNNTGTADVLQNCITTEIWQSLLLCHISVGRNVGRIPSSRITTRNLAIGSSTLSTGG